MKRKVTLIVGEYSIPLDVFLNCRVLQKKIDDICDLAVLGSCCWWLIEQHVP